MVTIRFTDTASEEFNEITGSHIGECIGIYLNEDRLANPRVVSAITDGTCQITNLATLEDAMDLVDKLYMTIEE